MGTVKKIGLWGAGLIALYLVVTHYTGAAKVESAGTTGGVNLVKAFQGR
jgi:hypothetical protein